jgi:hypothetical protein
MSIVATNVTILDGTESEEAALMREIRMDGVTAAIETEALSQIAQLADGASLIVIDNASDAADFDENNRRFVRTFIRRLGRIGRAVDAGVLLLAHIDKNAAKFGAQGNSYSGSTAWHNSVRSRLALIEENGALKLVHEKWSHTKRADDMPLRRVEHGVLMPHDGSPIETGIADPADVDAVLLAIRAAKAGNCRVPPGRTGAATAQSALSTFDELPSRLKGQRGREPFYRALNALLADGRVECAETRTAQRKTVEGIVPVDAPKGARAEPPYTPCAFGAQECAEAPKAPNTDSAHIRRTPIGASLESTEATEL